MKYMLLIYGEESAWSDAAREACYTSPPHMHGSLLPKVSIWRRTPSTCSYRYEHSDTRGQTVGDRWAICGNTGTIGRIFLIDAVNLDEAINIAERLPGAKIGTVEIRPVIDVNGLPD